MVDALALACGDGDADLLSRLAVEPVETVAVPAAPERADLDPVLSRLGGRRLVVCGSDAALAAVVQRLLRASALGEVPVGFAPTSPSSEVAAVWGLPVSFVDALKVALRGDPERAPLIRDDNGGVLVGLGLLRPIRGVIYCDDQVALRGQAGRVEVMPDPEAGPDTAQGGLVVRVVRTGLLGRRVATFEGRAVQVGCIPTVVQRNGEPYPRSTDKWTWYRHTEDWRLIRGLL